MQKQILPLVLALGAVLLFGAGCNTTSQPAASTAPVDTSPIAIGWAGPLTGDVAGIGNDALAATQLALDEVNAAGGINGRPLKLVAEDDKCDAKEANAAGTKLMTADKVPVIIGGECSGETLAMAPLAAQTKTVLFSPCSSAASVSSAGDYVFRSYPSDSYQGAYVADYLYTTLGKRRVAILAIQNDWGQGIKATFKEDFTKLGGSVVAEENFDGKTADLRTELIKIKTTNPDALYFLGENNASSLGGLRQVKELGLTIPIIGGDTFDDATIWKSGFAEGLRYSVPKINVPDVWRAALKAKGAAVTICAPGAYNNVKIIADIMKRVGTNSEAIKNALYQVKDYPGVNGPITIDSNGDLTTASFGIKMVKDKQADFVSN